jgi:hypothetical protein
MAAVVSVGTVVLDAGREPPVSSAADLFLKALARHFVADHPGRPGESSWAKPRWQFLLWPVRRILSFPGGGSPSRFSAVEHPITKIQGGSPAESLCCAPSIRGGLLNLVDHKNLDRALRRLQLEVELLIYGCEHGGSGVHHAAYETRAAVGWLIRFALPRKSEIEVSFEPGAIKDRVVHALPKHIGEILHLAVHEVESRADGAIWQSLRHTPRPRRTPS